MKAILEFTLPEEREEYEDAVNGSKYRYQLNEVWEKVFRPFYKYGYEDEKLNEIFERFGEDSYELIDRLSEIYRSVVRDEE